MILKNYYWYFQSALSNECCDNIIELAKNKKENLALTGPELEKVTQNKKLTKKDLKNLKKIRHSNVVWLNDKWIYETIQPYIHSANVNAGWNFEWDWSETSQFTKYEKNQHYDWHTDSWDEPYQDKNQINTYGKIRKLSVSCLLSDPKDFKGGELEFNILNKRKSLILKCEHLKTRGSIVVFPSFLLHRVRPVTKGKRYSLVLWNLGYPFK